MKIRAISKSQDVIDTIDGFIYAKQMKLNEFISECREKEVFKRLSIYIVSSWVLLQVVSLLAEPLNLPKASLTLLLLCLLIGFPLYMFLIWQYQLKVEGQAIHSEKRGFDSAKASSKPGLDIDPTAENQVLGPSSLNRFKKMYFFGLGVLSMITLVACTFIIKTNFFKAKTTPQVLLPSEPLSDKIAIVTFDNNTGSEDYDVLGKMAVDWILHGITQNKLAQVISPKIINDYSNVLKTTMAPTVEAKILAEYLKPSKVITGNFYLNGDKLIFQSSITDDKMAKTFIAFDAVSCDSETLCNA